MSSPSRSHRLTTLRRGTLVALALVSTGVALSACGASSPQSAAASEREAETKLADFARCLREHGIHAETSAGPNGGHGLKVEGPGPGGGPGQQTMQAAQKACARYRPEPKKLNLSPQQKVEDEEKVQKFARCMREHGIKVEVSTQGGGVQIGIHSHAGSGEPNPQSPGFQRAQESCQKLLPSPPGAKGGAAPLKSTSRAPAGGSASGLAFAAP